MSRLSIGHRVLLGIIDLAPTGGEVISLEDGIEQARKHARLAGHTINRKTFPRESEKAVEQLRRADIVVLVGVGFRLTDAGKKIASEVRNVKTSPRRTPKQWDGHLKKQRDEVKKHFTFEKLPQVLQLCKELRQERQANDTLRAENDEKQARIEELETQGQLLAPGPQSRSASPASEASFYTASARPSTAIQEYQPEGGDITQNKSASTPPASPIPRGLTAGGSFIVGGLLTPKRGCAALDDDDDMSVDDEVADMLLAAPSRSPPVTPTLQRSFSFNNPQAYPTPASVARPNAEAGPSRSPLYQSPGVGPSSRPTNLHVGERQANLGFLNTIKKRLFSLTKEPGNALGDIQEEIEEPQDLESVVGLVEKRFGQLRDDILKGEGEERQHAVRVRELERTIAELQQELKKLKAQNEGLSQRVAVLEGRLTEISAISSRKP